MHATVRQQLAVLLELADRMQAQAASSDWDGVGRLREQFQRCAEALFAGQVSHDEALALGDVIRRVSEINNEIIALCREARDAHRNDLDKLNQCRHAISSYSSHTD